MENKKFNFWISIFIPFISSLLAASLVLGIYIFNTPIKNFENTSNETSNPTLSIANKNTTSSNISEVAISDFSNSSVYASNKVLPSIVSIVVEYDVSYYGQTQTASAEGSGVIVTSDGYILTNNHVVSSSSSSIFFEVSDAKKVTVNLYNNTQEYEAQIIGSDDQTDLAVLKIEANNLIAAELGNSDNINVGEFVLSLGNPLGLEHSVTSGIISATNRTIPGDTGVYYSVIQTDCAINSGNSGGALVNSKGQVIGINTLKMSGTGIEGMGFAIPINDTIKIFNDLVEFGKVLRPYIGITGVDLNEVTANFYNLPVGIYIQEISVSSPSEAAGLKKGDVIIAIDGKEISTMAELNFIKNKKEIGDTIILTVQRSDEQMTIEITLGQSNWLPSVFYYISFVPLLSFKYPFI